MKVLYSFQENFWYSFLKVGLLGQMILYAYVLNNFARYCQNLFYKGCIILHSLQQWTGTSRGGRKEEAGIIRTWKLKGRPLRGGHCSAAVHTSGGRKRASGGQSGLRFQMMACGEEGAAPSGAWRRLPDELGLRPVRGCSPSSVGSRSAKPAGGWDHVSAHSRPPPRAWSTNAEVTLRGSAGQQEGASPASLSLTFHLLLSSPIDRSLKVG